MRTGLRIVALLALGVAGAALYRSGRSPGPAPAASNRAAVPIAAPPGIPDPAPKAPPVPAATGVLSSELRRDPLVDRWYRSIQRRDARGVMEAQASLLLREAETRPVLERIAQEEPDARVRAFSVTALSRFKTPPAGAFFTGRLEDGDPATRRAALAALEKLRVRESLARVEQLASGDPHEEVRAEASKTAAALRAK